MDNLTQHEKNIIKMVMNVTTDKIISDYERENKDDRFSRKVIKDYQTICDKLKDPLK